MDQVTVTEEQWEAERLRTRRMAIINSGLGMVMVPTLGVIALLLADLTASGSARYLAILAWLAVLSTPSTALIVVMSLRQQAKSDDVISSLAKQSADAASQASRSAAQRETQARRQEFDARLGNALQMAEDESEVVEVVEQAVQTVAPDAAMELLLADNSHAHLLRVASTSPTGAPPGCTVGAPDSCPASRRAQTLHFPDSTAFDACPKLRARVGGAVAAVCIPVSMMGRSVGVLHTVQDDDSAFDTDRVQALSTVANLAGSRLGLLRVMGDTQLQATTDSLTGLFNRRAFESRLASLRNDESLVSLAMADLDHFKALNDAYGHETGDRALRLFADVLRGSFRSTDLACRHGGEEFVVAFPACTVAQARKALDGMRTRLDAAITVAGLPQFTVSVGLIEATEQEDVPTLIARADRALFAAKNAGRNQVIIHAIDGSVVTATDEDRDDAPEPALEAANPPAGSTAG